MATPEGEKGLAVEPSRMPGTVMQIVADGEIGGSLC